MSLVGCHVMLHHRPLPAMGVVDTVQPLHVDSGQTRASEVGIRLFRKLPVLPTGTFRRGPQIIPMVSGC